MLCYVRSNHGAHRCNCFVDWSVGRSVGSLYKGRCVYFIAVNAWRKISFSCQVKRPFFKMIFCRLSHFPPRTAWMIWQKGDAFVCISLDYILYFFQMCVRTNWEFSIVRQCWIYFSLNSFELSSSCVNTAHKLSLFCLFYMNKNIWKKNNKHKANAQHIAVPFYHVRRDQITWYIFQTFTE